MFINKKIFLLTIVLLLTATRIFLFSEESDLTSDFEILKNALNDKNIDNIIGKKDYKNIIGFGYTDFNDIQKFYDSQVQGIINNNDTIQDEKALWQSIVYQSLKEPKEFRGEKLNNFTNLIITYHISVVREDIKLTIQLQKKIFLLGIKEYKLFGAKTIIDARPVILYIIVSARSLAR